MSAFLMQDIARMHAAELQQEVDNDRLVQTAKAGRTKHGHGDIVGAVLGALGLRGSLRPALNGGH